MLNEGELMLQKMVDEWGRKKVFERGYREFEPNEEMPPEFLRDLARMGLMGMFLPEEYGGSGASTLQTSLVSERLAFIWPSLQLLWGANASLAAYPIVRFGTKEQKRRYLPKIASGEILGCFALTEPDWGSDAASMGMKAEYDKKKHAWILNGTKRFITNAGLASFAVVFARVEGEKKSGKKHEGITAFLVGAPDLRIRGLKKQGISLRKIPKWGFLSCPFYDIIFDDVEVGPKAILGKVGEGFRIAMGTLDNGRISIAAQAVGIARRAHYEAVEYAKKRVAFGGPLIEKDAIAFKLAEQKARLDAQWELTLAASRAQDAGEEYTTMASEAKLLASRLAVDCSLMALEDIYGGLGYTTESIAMRIHHDAIATVIYEGSSNIQRMIIARGLRE